jgi:hypothetical protein
MTHPRRPISKRSRRGTLYALVLITVATSAGFVLVGMDLHRAQRRAAYAAEQTGHARSLALSGLEIGLDLVNRENWRTPLTKDGPILTDLPLGPGTLSISATDPNDANPANNTTDPLILTADARVGTARQRAAVTLTPAGEPIAALSTGLASSGDIDLPAGAAFGSAILHANGNVTASSAFVANPVSAAGNVTGGTFRATTRGSQSALELPAASVISTYTALATSIDFKLLPGGVLSGRLIGPGINPFGLPSARGVYLIDCGGADIFIRDSRIVGTLIILNPGSNSELDGGLIWEPNPSNDPILLVEGNFKLELANTPLSEATLMVNLNPASLALASSSNTTMTDTFDTRLRGLIYTTGNLSITTPFILTGTIITLGDVSITGSLNVETDRTLFTNPPAGFRSDIMRVSPGTWRQVTD